MRFIIYAAGQNKRFSSSLDGEPKGLQIVENKMLIEYGLSWMVNYNPSEIVIVVGFRKELFKKVINIIDLKNEMLKFKNEKFSINNICNLIKISYKEPIMTLRYYSYFFSKLLKQIFLQYIYS